MKDAGSTLSEFSSNPPLTRKESGQEYTLSSTKNLEHDASRRAKNEQGHSQTEANEKSDDSTPENTHHFHA